MLSGCNKLPTLYVGDGFMSDKKTWQKFEQLVVAIHKAEMNNAIIKWDDKINGRQFDVTVRFKNGDYDYLTVVECKNYSTPVKAEKVEALVTKARDAHADKAVMFSAKGFQSGAIDVARNHGIRLYSLQEPEKIPDDLLEPDPIEMVHIYDIVLIRPDGSIYELTNDPMKLRYYMNEMLIKHQLGDVTLEKLTRLYQNRLDGIQTDVEIPFRIDFEPSGIVTFPSMERESSFEVSAVYWKMKNVAGRRLKNDQGLDPAIYEMPYAVKNEIDGSIRYIEQNKIDIEQGDELIQGKFYKLKNLGYYYCIWVSGELIGLFMIESYQHGRFLQIEFTVLRENARNYVEVKDEDTLRRLNWRLAEHHRLGNKFSSRQGETRHAQLPIP